jgi:Xaa-Pro aminopeptidase
MSNFIIKDENNLYYECGYSCDNGILLNFEKEKFFITDHRYSKEASENITNSMVVSTDNILDKASELINKNSIKSITLNPKEWSLFSYEVLSSNCKKTIFKKEEDFLLQKRAIKSNDEIKIIKKAVKLGADGFSRFEAFIKESGIGKTEKELYYNNKNIMSNSGEYELSFEPIVAINANSAKPHARPSKTSLKYGDLLLIDSGIKYKRYCSDRTRCVELFEDNKWGFGLSQQFSSKMIQKAYDTLQKAHDETIDKIRVGIKAKDIDKITRDIVDKAGFGKYFTHSTGHGVGLNIHEYPFISSRCDMVIENNMVFTIEPGIYINNNYGLRLENIVSIENERAEIL